MSEPLNRRAIRGWLDLVTDACRGAQANLTPEEWDTFRVALARMLARSYTAARPRPAPGLPRLVIELPLEAAPSFRLEGSPSERRRLRDWLEANDDYAALVDQAFELVRRERERRAA